ncbi:facilitated trehalose transporter Tret1-like isoform X2 [Bombus huntii]|uniref:facilitated trehalose transporter Tret1-like isoform X2 n=1 Tax=Bombus huntii TaxID=85661 RepID=UPI0021A9EE7E|nr:facilitated trehalose transporter Tret1-like isoform X2 [Bombus huntii]
MKMSRKVSDPGSCGMIHLTWNLRPQEQKKETKSETTSMTDIEVDLEKVDDGAEKKVKPAKSRIYLQLISSIVVNLTLLASGICFTWSAIAIEQYEDLKNVDNAGWVVAAVNIGAVFGPILSALLLNRIGRKWLIYATSVPFIACWILTYFEKSWVYLFMARFCAGISIGILYAAVPLYIGELVETKIRGVCSSMMPVMLHLGYIFVYGVGPRVDKETFALMNIIPTAVFLLTAIWLPESPYYYLMKNKEKYAALAMTWLRRKNDNNDEIEEMKKSVEVERQGGYKELFTVKAHRKALLLVLLLLAGQQFSGYMGVLSYASTLVQSFHTNFDDNFILLIISAISMITSLISSCIVDKLGRKPVFLISSYGSSLCLIVIGVYFLLEKLDMDVRSLSLIPLIALILYVISVAFGLTSIPAIVTSEIFSIDMKSWATMVTNIYGSVLGIIVGKGYQLISDHVGNHVIFLAFASIELIIAITASVVMPETSQKTFSQIQEILNKSTAKHSNKTEGGEEETK